MFRHERNARAIAAAYYALLAAGKGCLLTVGVAVHSHRALRIHLGKQFVRHGTLPPDLIATIETAHKDRQAADYDLESFSDDVTQQRINTARERIREMASVA